MKFRLIVVFYLAYISSFSQIIDVNPYTGNGTVTIPLYTLRSGALSFPIAMTFDCSGLQANNNGGPIGTGWTITSGSINRDLRGIPDDYNSASRQGWLVNNNYSAIGSFIPSADDNLNDCTDEESDFNFLNSLGGFSGTTIKDTEPDVFNLSVPGLTGKFIFDNTGKPVFVDKKDYKISYELDINGEISVFEITDDSGTKYIFGSPSRSSISTVTDNESLIQYFKYQYQMYKGALNYYSSWYLLSINSSNGDEINFEYTSNQLLPTYEVELGNTVLTFLFKSIDEQPVYSSLFNITASGENKIEYTLKKTINKIPQFSAAFDKHHRIEIVNSSMLIPYGDYKMVQPFVSDLKVFNRYTNSQLRNFKLEYEPISNSFYEAENPDQYLFLRSVYEAGTLLTKARYFFDYYGVDFTTKKVNWPSTKGDHYGYLKKGSTEFYKTYIYPGLTGINRLRTKPIPAYTGEQHEASGDESESVDFTALLTGNLKEIITPEGGSKKLFYEPNTYWDEVAQVNCYGGGLRVRRTELHDGVSFAKDIVTNYQYKNDNGSSSGVPLYQPLRTFSTYAYSNDLLTPGLTPEQQLKNTTVIANGTELNEGYKSTFIGYKKVTMSQEGAGRTTFEFDVAAPFGTETALGWEASKTKVARDNPTNGFNIITHDVGPITGYYAYPFAPNPNFDFNRGLLRKVSYYDQAGKLVKQVIQDYDTISTPTKVFAIKLDQSQAYLTYDRTGGGGGVTTFNEMLPMFVYSRYETNVGAFIPLTKITTNTYDQNSTTSFISNIQTIEYANVSHTQPTRRVETGSDGVEYATNYKYSLDYTISNTWNAQDNNTKAINQLKNKNIIIPVEVWSTKREGSELPQVVTADLTLFEYDETLNIIYVKKKFAISSRDPISNFVPSTITNTANASTFTFEAAKYNSSVELLHQNAYGNAHSSLSSKQERVSSHQFIQSNITKLNAVGALADEIVFSDFEGSSGYEFDAVNVTSVGGRIAGWAGDLITTSSPKFTKTLKRGLGDFYSFSCWINAVGNGALSIKITDGVHQPLISSLPFSNTNSTWKYHSLKISTSSFNSNFSIEVTSSANVQIDDILFRPFTAPVSTILYNEKLNVIAETSDRGVTTQYEYDDFGRVIYVRDQDRNILKSYEYPVSFANSYARIGINPNTAIVNQQTMLTCYYKDSRPGITYKWKIMKFSDYQANPASMQDFSNAISSGSSNQLAYTFTEVTSYVVNVQVLYQSAVIKSNEHFDGINVTHPPLVVSICTNRPTEIDLCKATPLITTCNTTQTNGMILKANVTGGSGNYTYKWYNNQSGGNHFSTNQSITILGYAQPNTYECTVKDENTGLTNSAKIRITTFKSDPNCAPVSGQ